MGVSEGPALSTPVWHIDGRPEGARSPDDQIMGTYVHGLFDQPSACAALLRWAGLDSDGAIDVAQSREKSLDILANAALPLFNALSD
jgi:adenosylcobyric acid synthase